MDARGLRKSHPFLGPVAAVVPPAPRQVRSWPVLATLDQLFSGHAVVRTVGRLALVMSVFALLASLVLWYWGHTWFTGSAIFLAIWINCEAAGAMLEALAGRKT